MSSLEATTSTFLAMLGLSTTLININRQRQEPRHLLSVGGKACPTLVNRTNSKSPQDSASRTLPECVRTLNRPKLRACCTRFIFAADGYILTLSC